jgi:hypothetical protein
MSLVSVVCCKAEVSAMCRSIVQRSPTECVVSECDRGTVTRRPRPTGGGCCVMGGGKNTYTTTVRHYLKSDTES